MIRIARDLVLPDELVTQAVGVLAKRRAGKSYLARRLVEQLHHAGQQVVIIDPKGDWWGVRAAADGKSAGMPITILGGERGDVPLEAGAGELVAHLVVEERVSALLDLSMLRKREVAVFMAAFLETLYRLKAREIYRTPVMLVIDEADAIAPQKPQPGEERMLGAAEDIVRRGGQRGIGCTMITQRAAVLNKNVLTQVQVLVTLCTIAPQDLKAVREWVDVHGTVEQRGTLMGALPALPVGDAWVWSPGWPTNDGLFQRVHVLPIETFDSGATPKPGQKRTEPKTMADVDFDALRRKMAETIERAKADDPKTLRARIRDLERELGDARAAGASVDPDALAELRREATDAANERLGELIEGVRSAAVDQMEQLARDFDALAKSAIDRLCTELGERAVIHPAPISPREAAKRALVQHVVPRVVRVDRGAPPAEGSTLAKGERVCLIAIAQTKDGASREYVTVMTGYKRSTRDAYIQRLRIAGLVEDRGQIYATAEGRAALGDDYEPLPTGAALRTWWLEQLPDGERACLQVLIEAHPDPVARDAVGEATGYKRSTRDAYLQRLGTRRLVEDGGRGMVRAAALLFTGGR